MGRAAKTCPKPTVAQNNKYLVNKKTEQWLQKKLTSFISNKQKNSKSLPLANDVAGTRYTVFILTQQNTNTPIPLAMAVTPAPRAVPPQNNTTNLRPRK